MRPLIYLLDDSPAHLAQLVALLERSRRYRTKGFARAADALGEMEAEPPDAVLCDLALQDMGGTDFTRRLRLRFPTLPVILVTERGRESDAERALQAGATDFVTRPVEPATLLARLAHSLEEAPARELLSKVTESAFDPQGIVGSHPAIRALRSFVERVAAVPQVSVLLLGESGTGKNLVARAVHGAGAGARRRFVEINCAALPTHLLEAELFGFEKGAFTDAHQTKRGLVEVADGGTLFLDEIGTIAPEMQAKLLSFLESRTFRRLGSTQEATVKLRIIAATNLDLPAEVRAGRFREDLYYRLNVASYTLPALRQIRSDVPELARHFVQRAASYFGKPVPELDPAGLERLYAYTWPGNARELRNLIERSMIFSQGPILRLVEEPGTSAPRAAGAGVELPLGLTLEEVERRYIAATLEDTGGNVNAAAERLGVTRKVLWQRRKRHGMVVGRG